MHLHKKFKPDRFVFRGLTYSSSFSLGSDRSHNFYDVKSFTDIQMSREWGFENRKMKKKAASLNWTKADIEISFLMGHPRPLFRLFSVFFKKHQYNFTAN